MKVFLTGASSGIGEAFARHYAGQGATLGLVARRENALVAVVIYEGMGCIAVCLDNGVFVNPVLIFENSWLGHANGTTPLI